MTRPASRTVRSTVAGLTAGLVVTLSSAMGLSLAAPAHAENVVTPGDFTGYGFDQCMAPTQWQMNRWLDQSPFLAVGIYISGDSRACRTQPNLTPTWVGRQLRRGWRLLPITLGPQASCQPRFPRYGDDEKIIPKRGSDGSYAPARSQGVAEADKTVVAATALGIAAGSTLWYDLEGFDLANRDCRESALAFLSAWTTRLHKLGYVSGVYSSAGSGIKALDDARVRRPGAFALPDQIWVARWSGVPGRINDPGHTYLRADGWMPHARVHQYQGGHDETWGGVRINIDRNFLDLGRGSWAAPETHCTKVQVSFARYQFLRPPTTDRTPDPAQVRALQCLLKEKGVYAGPLTGSYNAATIRAANAWQVRHGFGASPNWTKRHWMSLLIDGPGPVLKFGSAGEAVRRLQRTLNAANPRTHLVVDGVFGSTTQTALRAWQDKLGLEVSGVVASESWAGLRAGLR